MSTRGGRARWPNLFLAGPPRTATTALWRALGSHADVFMCPVKEPSFFADPNADERSYLDLFAKAQDERYLGEATPWYLHLEDVTERIAAVSPEAHVVATLRSPVERIRSAYWNRIKHGLDSGSFEAVIGPLREHRPSHLIAQGFYTKALERWFGVFGERVHVLVFEDLVEEPAPILRRLSAELRLEPPVETLAPANPFGLPRGKLAARALKAESLRRASRTVLPDAVRDRAWRALQRGSDKPPLDPALQARLEELYAPDRAALEALLDRKLPW
jgi:hypothetical protein